ncbi:MAG: peptide-methionine (R)-S-oxide reductase MsrB [Brevinema sp.]
MKNVIPLLILMISIYNHPFTQNNRIAVLVSGSFWCTEANLEKLLGVVDVVSGYTGGTEPDPTYQQVASGKTSHREAVYVVYDPNIISYQQLLNTFLRTIDPTENNQKAIIYTSSEEQQKIAQDLIKRIQDSSYFSKKNFSVDILPITTFYPAESYHQNYVKNNPTQYNFYRSKEQQHITRVWDKVPQSFLLSEEVSMPYTSNQGMEEKFAQFVKPSQKELQEQLSPIQYAVTQRDSTEPPFKNEYVDYKERGIYVDIVSGEPLFSSRDKFDSGTGWPSFTIPIAEHFIVEKTDLALFMKRTEIRSRYADSHLGHVFNDGPNGALRYCMNSAALRFIPYDKMVEEGYGDYLSMV